MARNAVAIHAERKENFVKVGVDGNGHDMMESTGDDYNPDMIKPGAYRIADGVNHGFMVCCPCGCGHMFALTTNDVPAGDPPSMNNDISVDYPGHLWAGRLLNGVWTEKV